ncbi:fumarylacetoacetate hydrolase family protein [Burkholderia cenocepacia]|uniref:fumarylacetoacetate hydrolase family protein n=1 Tax=Burkholderia cepacia complex TaxID=87882 RepID=UPI001B9A0E0C|nr:MULTISPECIES: fumarylacetoacetate hydrolase family protein [Burkholderia cepacia complex]MBR8378500.1 fumarylacetoacetate hydrolase family protein [Burkholderia cenocepacia]MDN7559833.1 fumarylacetoacetate hydrolase family protein [Burkholderia orbicola]
MNYKLFQFLPSSGSPELGIVVADQAYRLSDCTLETYLTDVGAQHERMKELALRIAEGAELPETIDIGATRLVAPTLETATIYACGANYRDHVEAMAKVMNTVVNDPRASGAPPFFFMIPGRTGLAGHGEHVNYPSGVKRLDFEGELAVIIGRRARNVSEAGALSYVAGYSCANDLSARDRLVRPQEDASSPFRFDWIGAKVFPQSCPIGPVLTPSEYIADPEDLAIKTWVNDELRQDSNTKNHIYSISEQIAFLSSRFDLLPGDVLITGTPAGVGAENGRFLSKGDKIKIEIAGLGALSTRIA